MPENGDVNLGRVNALGIGISPISLDIALQQIGDWISNRKRRYVCVCTVHTVMESRRSESLRRVLNGSGMATPDGMPLVWLARLAGHSGVGRVYGPDIMLAEMEDSVRTGHRHFFYGGRPGVTDRLRKTFTSRFPGVAIVGTFTPPIAPVEELCNSDTADLINQARPDIVWVGISTPKQEMWMAGMRTLLQAPVLIGVGAAFDFHSGTVRQAPPWMQRIGLEWLFRLVSDPRRLWRRYLVDNPWFIGAVTLQRLGLKRYEI